MRLAAPAGARDRHHTAISAPEQADDPRELVITADQRRT
jgi:hypothetical protein